MRRSAQLTRPRIRPRSNASCALSLPNRMWADVRPDEATGTLLNLVIGNSGPTVATNVRVRIEPPLLAIDQLRDRVEAAHAQLASGVGSLGPGSVRTWPLGQGFNLIPDRGSQAHTLTVAAEGPLQDRIYADLRGGPGGLPRNARPAGWEPSSIDLGRARAWRNDSRR
jgi:hypothetical protein